MVIVRLAGGLGNQLFQYAAGRALAERHGVPLRLDLTHLARDPLRSYRLDRFQIAATVATPAEVARLTHADAGRLLAKGFSFLQRYLPPARRAIFVQRQDDFDPRFTALSGHVYLIGYFQSPRYFAHMADQIRMELTLREPPDALNRALLEAITSCAAVSVHVRRGDYLTNPLYRDICTPGYYRAAMREIAARVDAPHFFVFSDDIAWAQDNLRIAYPVTYVSHNGPARDHEDLRLMQHCHHHIIANSSFSWWGAWLATRRGQIVIAPPRWLNVAAREPYALIPESWIRISGATGKEDH